MTDEFRHSDLRLGDGYILYWEHGWAVWHIVSSPGGDFDVCAPVWNSAMGQVNQHDQRFDRLDVRVHECRATVLLRAEEFRRLLMVLALDERLGAEEVQRLVDKERNHACK